jgi:hypothetical protein
MFSVQLSDSLTISSICFSHCTQLRFSRVCTSQSAHTQPLELAWARFIFNSHVHGAPFCDQGPHAPYVHESGDHYQCQLGAGVSDDNLSEKMHDGGVAGHGHGLNALNHDVPPEFDPQCSDDAPSGSPESLLLGHDPLKKHVAFSHPPWEVNMGILDLKKYFQQSKISVQETGGKISDPKQLTSALIRACLKLSLPCYMKSHCKQQPWFSFCHWNDTFI